MSTFFEKPFFAKVRQLKEPRPLVESQNNKEHDISQRGLKKKKKTEIMLIVVKRDR